MSILCISHKLELAIHDAFKRSKLNSDAEEQLQTVYYLFWRANLKWCLFKKHANVLEIKYRCFKRPGGTRWAEHQVTALNTFLYKIHNLLSFLNDEIALPYNQTMKKEKKCLEGVLKQCQSLEVLLFQSIKVDLLQIIKPTSKALESIKTLLPEDVTIVENTLQQYSDLLERLNGDGVETLREKNVFPTLNKEILHLIIFDKYDTSLGHNTRQDPGHVGAYTFCGCILSGRDLEVRLQNVFNEVILIVEVLKESLEARLSFLSDDPLLSAASVLLDASSYKNRNIEFILKVAEKVHEHFAKPLAENGFIKLCLGESNFEKKYKLGNIIR